MGILKHANRLVAAVASGAAVAAVALTVNLVSPSEAQAQEFKLRYSELGPPRGPRAAAMQWWADEIKARSDGRVEIEFFWSQSLTKAKDTYKAVGAGLTDVGTVLGVYTPAELPIWNLANVPFSGRDNWLGPKVWQEMRKLSPELREETEKKGVRILANFTTGPVDIISKKPILKLEDLAGIKIRSTGGWSVLMKELGATPISIGFGELYQALDKGTVDAATSYVTSTRAYKHYEVVNHVTEVQMGQLLGFGIGINTRTFDRMPEDLQQIILEVSDDFIDKAAELYTKDVEEARAAMTAGIDGKKVEFHTLPDEERARWKEKAEFFVSDWVEKISATGLDGQAFVDQLNGLTAKYQEELDTLGYPWER